MADCTVAKSPFLPSNSQRWYFPCFIEGFIVECTWQYIGFVSKLTSICVTLPEAQCVILLTELWRYLLPCSVMPSTTSQVDIHSSYSWIKKSQKFKNKNPGHLFVNSLMFDSVISCHPESGVHVGCSRGLTSTLEINQLVVSGTWKNHQHVLQLIFFFNTCSFMNPRINKDYKIFPSSWL